MKFKLIVKVCVLILFIIVLLGFLIKRYPRINKISCISQFGPCSSNVNKSLSSVENGGYYDVNKEITKILKENEFVENHVNRFKFPSTLEVYVMEIKPFAALYNTDLALYTILDQNGKVLDISENTGLPYIVFNGMKIGEGSIVDKEVLFEVQLLVRINAIKAVKNAYNEPDSLKLVLDNNVNVLLPKSGDQDILIGSLILIENRLNKDKENFMIESSGTMNSELTFDSKYICENGCIIDLRYKNPVIKKQ